MDVRRAGPDDAGAVAGLLHDFNTEFATPVPNLADLSRRFATMLGRPDVLVLLAVAPDGDPARPDGFALLTLRPTPYVDGPLAQLEELYVRPDLRDQGIGTALMARVFEELTAREAGELHINVDESDGDTRRFYERLGFTNIEPGTDERMLFYLREL